MASEPCNGCGTDVPIAGGIANLWTTEKRTTGGITLEFEDGTEHFLCYDCIERLPDYPTTSDVAALADPDSSSERGPAPEHDDGAN